MTPSANKAWLDQKIEETLEPDLPICDPHHHLAPRSECRQLTGP